MEFMAANLSSKTVVDQIGHTFTLPNTMLKIVSLVPSQTELLFDIGLEDNIVGITKFCVHPRRKVSHITKVGGTKRFNFDRIAALKPNLIIGNKEENYQEGIRKLQLQYPVWMSDIKTMADNLAMIEAIGTITNKLNEARVMISRINQMLSGFDKISYKSVVYLIWKNPLMGVGGNSYINHLLSLCGFDNCLKHQERYPEITEEALATLSPQLILLSSEPFPFNLKHIPDIQKICPDATVVLVDGEMFSWYGSRTLKAIPYFESLKKEVL